jgi:phosphoglycolate phosphatase-like HAD superfamily hydrolase
LLAAGLSPGQAQEIEAGCRARFRQFEHDIRPFPFVEETLDQILAAGCNVTIVSQAPLSTLEISTRLVELGLADHISAVNCSGIDVGSGPDLFQRLVRYCGAPQEAVYVGRGVGQLAAAHRSHMQTVAFNCDADARADFYIEQFDQLPEVLNLGRQPMLAAG